jgi:hypothetical protein
LDLLPSRFERVGIVRHQGCNVASWNKRDSARVQLGNEVFINGRYPIIFIHFTSGTISEITRDIYDGDALLKPYLKKYLALLKKHTPALVSLA